jgi:hypothetical protein
MGKGYIIPLLKYKVIPADADKFLSGFLEQVVKNV